jgi:hypothetical protein
MALEVKVFGKPDCEFCKTTMKKFETFFGRWGIDKNSTPLNFFDMETADGLAEGAFYSVTKIPSTVIEKDGEQIGFWHGKVPLSQEFQEHFVELKPASSKDLN